MSGELPITHRTSTGTSGHRALGLDALKGVAIVALVGLEAFRAVSGGALLAGEVFLVLAGFFTVGSLRRLDHLAALPAAAVRRAARLAVPWLPVLVFLVVYARQLAGPVDGHRNAGNAIASTLMVSNWWYIVSDQSWFSRSHASPLLSTWGVSLIVQCQVLAVFVWFAVLRPLAARRARIHATTDPETRPATDASTDPEPDPDAEPEPTTTTRTFGWTPVVLAGGGALVSALWMLVLSRLHSVAGSGAYPLGFDPSATSAGLVSFLHIDPFADPTRLALGLDTRLQGFLMGITAALLVRRGVGGTLSSATRHAVQGGAIGLLVLVVAAAGREATWIFSGGFLLVDVLVVAIIVTLLVPTANARPTASESGLIHIALQPVAYFGRAAYAIFAWYFPIYVVVSEPRNDWPPDQVGAVRLGLTLAAGLATHLLLEQLPQRLLGQPSQRNRLRLVRFIAIPTSLLLVFTFVNDTPSYTPIFNTLEPDGRPAVMVAGDSMAYILGIETSSYSTDANFGVLTRLSALPGCGLTNGVLLNRGNRAQAAPECETWRTDWAAQVDQYDPALSLLLAWAWELHDHELIEDGKTVLYKVGTPEWYTHERAILEDVVEVTTRRTGHVAFLTMPCVDPDADTPSHPTSDAIEPFRVTTMNALLRETAANHPDRVSVIDLNAYVCPDGNYRAYINGTLISDDSVHFTHEGAQLIWNEFVGPRVADLLHVR